MNLASGGVEPLLKDDGERGARATGLTPRSPKSALPLTYCCRPVDVEAHSRPSCRRGVASSATAPARPTEHQ